MTENKKHIPLIHNYCDRWCERCPFTSRCAAYIPPSIDGNEGHTSLGKNTLLENVSVDFEQIMELLKQEAESIGMDWDALVQEAKEIQIDTPVCTPKYVEIMKNTQEYTTITTKWLNSNHHKIVEFADQMCFNMDLGIANAPATAFVVGNAIEVIQWHIAIIESKANRAMRGITDNPVAHISPQSDANGTAKVTVRSIEKSIEAWEVLRTAMPELSDELLDQLSVLSKIKREITSIFPMYKHFIRPGFDSLKTEEFFVEV